MALYKKRAKIRVTGRYQANDPQIPCGQDPGKAIMAKEPPLAPHLRQIRRYKMGFKDGNSTAINLNRLLNQSHL